MNLQNRAVVVFGAYGHTADFVLAELRARGCTPILAGRDAERLRAAGGMYPDAPVRVASVVDPDSLDRALAGAAAVINCAGPFAATAPPVMDATLRAQVHYLDVTAEQAVALSAFERLADGARDAGVVIAPSMAFYGGLGDLLATAAMGDWADADAIRLAIGLDSWHPTRGTRLTVERNAGRHLVFTRGRLVPPTRPPATAEWAFPTLLGVREVTELSLADQVTISRHLPAPEITCYMNREPLRDLGDPTTPPPAATGGGGRSAQIFAVDAVVEKAGERRRATASGRDIYAVTAPIVVEAAVRILDGRFKTAGVAAAGELFDARDFLRALDPAHLSVTMT